MNTTVKIILIDLAGLALFGALVMFPDAVGGILFLGVMLGFGYIVLDAVVCQWTWKDTAIVASPLIFGTLRRANRDEFR
jgi:hypothetical protein